MSCVFRDLFGICCFCCDSFDFLFFSDSVAFFFLFFLGLVWGLFVSRWCFFVFLGSARFFSVFCCDSLGFVLFFLVFVNRLVFFFFAGRLYFCFFAIRSGFFCSFFCDSFRIFFCVVSRLGFVVFVVTRLFFCESFWIFLFSFRFLWAFLCLRDSFGIRFVPL